MAEQSIQAACWALRLLASGEQSACRCAWGPDRFVAVPAAVLDTPADVAEKTGRPRAGAGSEPEANGSRRLCSVAHATAH